jgi:hypothetical protein
MTKVRIAVVAALAALGFAAVAHAVTNTYTLSGKVSPSKAGTKKKPMPVSVSFKIGVAETAGQRPASIKAVEVQIPNGKVNGKSFPKCSVAILTDKGPSGCPKGSQVGGGQFDSIAGSSTDPNDKSLACRATAKAFNAANGHLLIFVSGAPPTCAIAINKTIDATLKTSGSTTTLKFTIPDDLVHPVPGFDNTPTSILGSVKKLTRNVKGKKVPFIASTGCSGGKHVIKSKVTLENGTVQQVTGEVPCKK